MGRSQPSRSGIGLMASGRGLDSIDSHIFLAKLHTMRIEFDYAIWLSYGYHMAIIWLSYGYHMALKWGPPKVCPEEKVAVWFMMIYDDLGWDFGMPCFQTNPATRNRPTLVLLHWRRCVKTMHRSVSAALCRAPYSSRCRDHGKLEIAKVWACRTMRGYPWIPHIDGIHDG